MGGRLTGRGLLLLVLGCGGWDAAAGANLADGAALYGVRALVLEEFRLCISGTCDPNDHAAEFGLLYGRILRRDYSSLSVSGGLGVWFGAEYKADGGTGIHTEDRFVTAGIPLEVRAFFTPLPFAGIGATVFANINPQHSAVGVMFGLQLGRLRD